MMGARTSATTAIEMTIFCVLGRLDLSVREMNRGQQMQALRVLPVKR
jgi:hypothetical protein